MFFCLFFSFSPLLWLRLYSRRAKVESCKCCLWVKYLGLQRKACGSSCILYEHTAAFLIQSLSDVTGSEKKCCSGFIVYLYPPRTLNIRAVWIQNAICLILGGNCHHKKFRNSDKTSAKVFRWLITWIISHMLCGFFFFQLAVVGCLILYSNLFIFWNMLMWNWRLAEACGKIRLTVAG